MNVVLVHAGDVIEDAFLFRVHASQAVLDDDRELVGESRIVGDTVRNRARGEMTVTVLVLQAFARERRTSRRATDPMLLPLLPDISWLGLAGQRFGSPACRPVGSFRQNLGQSMIDQPDSNRQSTNAAAGGRLF